MQNSSEWDRDKEMNWNPNPSVPINLSTLQWDVGNAYKAFISFLRALSPLLALSYSFHHKKPYTSITLNCMYDVQASCCSY